jgi:hypothetical protein
MPGAMAVRCSTPCVCAPELLADGGTILIVHSEFADIDRTIEGLRAGRSARGCRCRTMDPFGPVLSARAHWLERIGLLDAGRRRERWRLCGGTFGERPKAGTVRIAGGPGHGARPGVHRKG